MIGNGQGKLHASGLTSSSYKMSYRYLSQLIRINYKWCVTRTLECSSKVPKWYLKKKNGPSQSGFRRVGTQPKVQAAKSFSYIGVRWRWFNCQGDFLFQYFQSDAQG